MAKEKIWQIRKRALTPMYSKKQSIIHDNIWNFETYNCSGWFPRCHYVQRHNKNTNLILGIRF